MYKGVRPVLLMLMFAADAAALHAACPGPDFSGRNLVSQDFRGQDLDCADFTGADVAGAQFDRARLNGADFTDAIAAGASFDGAIAREAIFVRANLVSARLARGNFAGANFFNANLRWADARHGSFDRADLSWTYLQFTDFSFASIAAANLAAADAAHVRMLNADLQCSTFTGGVFSDAEWDDANLSRTIDHPDGPAPTRVAAHFHKDAERWYAFDYREGPPVVQGRRPLAYEPTGGLHDAGFAWSDDRSWGVDVPDGNSIFPLLFSLDAGPANIEDGVVVAYLRSKDLELHGGTINFSVLNPGGTRYRAPINVAVSETEWTEVVFPLNMTQSWSATYVRPGTTQATVSEVLRSASQIGFLLNDFPPATPPTGRLEIASFVLTMSAAGTADYAAAKPLNAFCNTPGRVIPFTQAEL